ncbi:hypothetical protein ACP275_04G157300 [Erythranthe tilingii]
MAIMEEDSPKRRRVGLIYDDRMCKHADPVDDDHVENPNRIRAIWDKLNASGLAQRCIVLNAKEAKDNHLASVHSEKHIKLIKNISSRKKSTMKRTAEKLDSIYFNEGSSEASSLAAGSVIQAAEKVAKGELDSAFAIVRPPGHHAEETEPMGFCLYNNIAVAASFLLNRRPKLGVGKILIVDWDVHHGNGTQKMFYDDPRVLTFSVHRHDSGEFYPFGNDGSYNMIGEGAGAGYNINVPWETDSCGDADYFAVWDHVLIPVAKKFDPDMIMVAAGFDAALGDPLGGCCLSPYAYSVMLRKLMDISRGKNIVLALEGGYDPVSLANSAEACVEVLLQDKPLMRSSVDLPLKSTALVIRTVRQALSKYWPVLASELTDKVINSSRRPSSQTEDVADTSTASVKLNSKVEQVRSAERKNNKKRNVAGELVLKFMKEQCLAVKNGAKNTSPFAGPTGTKLQPPKAPIADPQKGGNPPKRTRSSGEDPKKILQCMRESAFQRDKEIVSEMSPEEHCAQIAYHTAKLSAMATARRSDRIRALDEERRKAVEEVESLKAKCLSLEDEVARTKEELAKSVKKNGSVRAKSYNKGFSDLLRSTEFRHVMELYTEALMAAYRNSTLFLSKLAEVARFNYLEAFRLCREKIRKAGSDLVLDPIASLDKLKVEDLPAPDWNGNPDEPVDYPWWDGIYEKVVDDYFKEMKASGSPRSGSSNVNEMICHI